MTIIQSDIKAGIAGTGFIGPAHIEALRRLGIHVLGVCGDVPQRAVEKARELRLDKAYPSFEALLADPQVAVVHIATPNFLHYPQAKAALLAGKHVVCEKPLAMTVQQSAELVRLARQQQRVNAINFNLRFYPLCRQAHAMLKSGELGQVYLIHGSYLQDWLLLPTDWNWRLEPELGGELRAVADIGSHWLDLAHYVTGLEVEAVFADFQTFLPVRKKPTRAIDTFSGKLETAQEYSEQPIATEDYAAIILRFKGGARGMVTVSQVSSGRKNRLSFEVNAARSSLAWDSERPNELWVGHRERANELLMKDPSLLLPEARAFTSYPGGHNEGYPDTFKQLYSAVYGYIQAGDFDAQPDFPTFANGHLVQVLCGAILRSAREARWVELGEVTDGLSTA